MNTTALVLDKPSQIEMFGLVALRGALRLEKAGMKRSRGASALSMARQQGYKGNIDKVLEQVHAKIVAARPVEQK